MTREQLKALMPNATDDELTATLNAMHAEQKPPAIKDDELAMLKKKAKQLDDYEADKLSNEEKVQKALKDAEALKLANAKLLNRTKATAELIKGGFTAEEVEKFIDGLVTDNEESTLANVKNIVDVYTIKAENLKKAAKADFLKDTPKPDDKGGTTPPPKPLTEAEKIADSLSKNAAENAKASKSALDYYTGG